MKRRMLSLADWLLLRLRYPFPLVHDWMPDWLDAIHLVPKRPFLKISRMIDDRLNDMDLEETC